MPRHISDEALDALKRSEAFRSTIYKDEAGLDTIGYGHLLTEADVKNNRFALCMTEPAAVELLREDLAFAELAVEDSVKVELNQNQFDALVDFVFNVGVAAFGRSTLLKKLNRGEYAAVPEELIKWTKVRVDGAMRDSKGLKRRREKEVARWTRAI